MIESSAFTGNFVSDAFLFIGLMLVWNLLGRWWHDHNGVPEIQNFKARLLYQASSLIHVLTIAIVIFTILVFLISGTIKNPTDFRYVTF